MEGRIVLITGGAGNLGRSVTRTFLEAGARVAVPFYKTDKPSALDDLASTFRDRLLPFALDLTTERGAEQAIRQVVEWGGGLDCVAHLVGGYAGGARLADTPLETWSRMIDLNLTSAFLTARFAIPALLEKGGGSLVFVSSRAAYTPTPGQAAYAATKAALINLVGSMAAEYGAEGIRANVIVPDTIDTEDNRRALPDADYSNWTRPEAIARIVLFLASDASGPINGAAVPIFGPG